MNIVQITPGAGGMYCGNCFRDNALVAELRKLGHPTLMVPLYLPMTLDEADQSAGTPIFFNGVNVYLEQKSAFFRHAPEWLHKLLASPKLLQWAGRRAARTRPEDVGDLTVSMLQGEEGNQARELDDFIAWLRPQPRPDVVCLSNALLIGMARRIKAELGAPVACMLQGEDYFLDALAEPHRSAAWRTLAERATGVDLFIAPSRYFGDLMTRRLKLPANKVKVIFNGINLDGFGTQNPESRIQGPPVLGYFARMCPEKGLDTLVEAFIQIRKRDRVKNLKLHVGGGCGPGDEAFVQKQIGKLQSAGVRDDAEFHKNLARAAKLDFLRSLTVMSVPARFGEAFGLYLVEAFAAGVPVVQPRVASFPELIATSGAGVVCEANPAALAESLEALLLDPARIHALGAAGEKAARDIFSVERMTLDMVAAFHELGK